MKIAVQLYSLRDIIKGSGENLLAILPRVKALGYDGVEFAGYFGVDAATLRAALDSAGVIPFDELKKAAHLEIDTYWSFVAGQDNYKLITENRDRIAQLHVKDGIGHTPKALGEGNCDIPEVVRAAKDIGIEWLIVENDDPVPNGLDDIGRSIKYLKSII